jgi:two-component system response regulator HydG
MSPKGNNAQILVVDDAKDTLEVIQRNLKSKDYSVLTATSAPEAVTILESAKIDLVITDLKMPKVDGFDLIQHIRNNYKDTEVMMITGYPSIEGAVKAVKLGADEYLAKPFTDTELFAAVHRSLEKLSLRRTSQKISKKTLVTYHGIIGESESMCGVLEAISRASATAATVLITGESGTGKELAARAIHYNSKRASAPFIPVNCGAIPEELLESELFGYVKGAFTGADHSRAGFFQTADGGTIFLDEISETTLSTQVKFLRVLQDGEIFMVGSRRPVKVDVRILSATNKDLQALMKKGKFREDLFYRLNVIPIEMPPLRERGNDILLLLHHFAERYAKESGKSPPDLSAKALGILKKYYWPGNVRELENVVQRLTVMTDGDIIDVPDLPSLMRFSALKGRGLNRTLTEVETEYILNVLENVGGNKSKASEILGIDRKTLRLKLNKIQHN